VLIVFKTHKLEEKQSKSVRESRYVLDVLVEDKVLCEAWLEISTDPICGAEQKGFSYCRKVGKFFHERRKICEKPFQSDWNDLSLSKRWALSMQSVASSNDHLKRSKKGKLAASRRLTW
jgi:hypothetical protein